MSLSELEITGPIEVTDGIVKYDCSDPVTSNQVLHIERYSRPNNKCSSISWNPNFDLERALVGINQVWVNQKANLIVDPMKADDDDLFHYEFEAPLTVEEMLSVHPDGIKWMRVNTPQNQRMPDFFIPLNRRISSPAGIIFGYPPILDWRHFLPLYQQTAELPYGDEEAIHRAITSTGIEVI